MTALYVAVAVYVVGVVHLVDAAHRLRPFERPPNWLTTALAWPVWTVLGAALTVRATVGRVLRFVDDEVGELR